ncbi:citrate lyase subunit beta/citryl-CoA lyase [Rhizobium azooxidifex]|uniref:Citrate lyase subunit beta/citryl-CoA lyase n=1 Tax=Mycoplana azooxidifex TaxID=1636188 RepID=A0A7W6GJE8_9HYPH|nr:CoA ester lyase [Mycoplana azooxidifex]MBB3977073.1 citrate lyase subunit beta/citryl-CoA lyase [Mycoplana azooxidifex]
MNPPFQNHPLRLRRSLLSVPASNARALEKSSSLACDGVIFDLEDSVAPEKKAEARAALKRHFATLDRAGGRECIVRINPLSEDDGAADLEAVLECAPDAVLLPKVSGPQDVLDAADWLSEQGADDSPRLWAMIETPAAILNLAAIAEVGRTSGGRLDCLVIGLNDLRLATGIADVPGRPYLAPLLVQAVVAARASGLDVIDSVHNGFSDLDAFAAECEQGRQMGFDGKMLIHPAQIAGANRLFGVPEAAAEDARAIVEAFALPENAGKGAINFDGRMVERLHLDQAARLVAKAKLIADKESSP